MAVSKREPARDANRDPITHEAGAHPVGAGVGAAAGTTAGAAAGAAAAVAAGAAMGSAVGPVGTAAGAVIGGIAGGIGGGYAGKGVAEAIDPTAEEAYWQEQFKSSGYPTKADFEKYRPAYRYGVDSYLHYQGRAFDEIQGEMGKGWSNARGASTLNWNEAQPAARDAYQRLCQRGAGQSCCNPNG